MQESGPGIAARSAAPEPRSSGGHGLEFERFYFQHYHHETGTGYERDDGWLRQFSRVADDIVRTLEPASLLDAGCAYGLLVEKLRERDVDAWGIDASEYAIGRVAEPVRPYCWLGSVTKPLPEGMPPRYEVVACIEVLEHVVPEETDLAIAQLCELADRVLFSSVPDGYGEATHVNLRPPEDWSALFARHGFFRVPDFDARFVSPWAVLYERGSSVLADVVRSYDRIVSRLIAETRELRDLALALERRVAEVEDDEHERLRRELAERDARLAELEPELADARRLLRSRSGRLLRAWHAGRGAFRKTQ